MPLIINLWSYLFTSPKVANASVIVDIYGVNFADVKMAQGCLNEPFTLVRTRTPGDEHWGRRAWHHHLQQDPGLAQELDVSDANKNQRKIFNFGDSFQNGLGLFRFVLVSVSQAFKI
jgi:hypothetical protein